MDKHSFRALIQKIQSVDLRSSSFYNFAASRTLQELARLAGGSFGRPTDFILVLTNRCNARCLHCHSWKLPAEPHELTTNQWSEELTKLRKWLGPVRLSITGGETLVRQDSLTICRKAAELGFSVEFLTNGYLLTSDIANQLVASGVKRVTISMDGSEAGIHDKIRGRSEFFDRATNAMRLLSAERKESGKALALWGKTTVMSYNFRDLPNIPRLAAELGIDGIKFQGVSPVYYSSQLFDREWYKNNPLWVDDLDALSQSIGLLKHMKIEGDAILNSLEDLSLIEDYFRNPDVFSHKIHSHDDDKVAHKCLAWNGGLQIMPNGGMKSCYWMKPFAYLQDGSPASVYKRRPKCWTRPCEFEKFL